MSRTNADVFSLEVKHLQGHPTLLLFLWLLATEARLTYMCDYMHDVKRLITISTVCLSLLALLAVFFFHGLPRIRGRVHNNRVRLLLC